MKAFTLAILLLSSFVSTGCSKAVENATNKCREAHKRYVGGNPLDNCKLCCRVALNEERVDNGTGTISGDQCICSAK